MKNILNNKFLIILISFILIFLTFVSNVFAYDLVVNNGNSYSFPDEIYSVVSSHKYYNDNYYCIAIRYTVDHNYYVTFIKKTDSLKVYINSPSDFSVSENIDRYELVFDSNYNLISESSEFNLNTFFSAGQNFGHLCSSEILFLGKNIYYNSDGSVFFQPPPQEITQILVGETEKAQVMEQIQIMITGFLKYLIVFVISVIAFYKGWKFLSRQFKTA